MSILASFISRYVSISASIFTGMSAYDYFMRSRTYSAVFEELANEKNKTIRCGIIYGFGGFRTLAELIQKRDKGKEKVLISYRVMP